MGNYTKELVEGGWFGCLGLRSLRVDLGICLLLRWIQVLGCVLDYKSFRSVGVDAHRLLPKQTNKKKSLGTTDCHATLYLFEVRVTCTK